MFRPRPTSAPIAYFSMEMGVEASIPTYSGGLGILAGDTLRAAADLGVPMVAVTLLYRNGYFRQQLDKHGNQRELSYPWNPAEQLQRLPIEVTIQIEDRAVAIGAWRFIVTGITGQQLPIYFLDTGLPANSTDAQAFTDCLYGGDLRLRLCQEAILGFGGVAMLRALGYAHIELYHMNEGHSALLALALLNDEKQRRDPGTRYTLEMLCERVRGHCIFTTHTPIPAGHDQFPLSLVADVLGNDVSTTLAEIQCGPEGTLNMTYLALYFSQYVNGVAMRHSEVSQHMFPHYPINSITNGIHAATWTAPPLGALYDRYIPAWWLDNHYLRYAVVIPLADIIESHQQAKRILIDDIRRRSALVFDPSVFTIGFARRATAYKRAPMLFADIERLRSIAQNSGALQIVYAGKAHPRDEGGKALIRDIVAAMRALGNDIRGVYLEEYDIELAKTLCAGVDLWLNTPHKPLEASGTSGMKAAVNAVPSLSILDGWWIEGHLEGVTGWAIGEHWTEDSNLELEVESLYTKLERSIIPLFYRQPLSFAEIMRTAIAINGSFFNTHRMMLQYMRNAYSPVLKSSLQESPAAACGSNRVDD